MDAKTLTPRSSTHDKKKILDKIAIKLGGVKMIVEEI